LILPDSSIWIDHLRKATPQLIALLEDGEIFGHPFVTGEVSLGSLAQRERIIAELSALPQLAVQRHERVALLIESTPLWGEGVGYIDAHLLASIKMVPGAQLWTGDKRLHTQAARLGIAYLA
jgi:predicted nucleic acid-binding protein